MVVNVAQSFSGIQRPVLFAKLSSKDLDILVIGGGITGAGIALDAQIRGMNTGLIEMQDFAAGTSSRSTKLVHGGLRYLKQLEFKLVSEVGKERATVYENAPHVTTPVWMLLPLIEGGTFGKLSTSVGLRIYDRLAGVKKNERRKMLGKKETLSKEPLLCKNGLKGSGYYVEYRTDDARLTLEVMKEAVSHGATAANHVKAEEFIYENGKVVGVHAKDMLTGETREIRAKKIINAAGPWVDTLREKDQSKKGKQLHLTKGVHITIDERNFPLRQAVYFDVADGRMIFAIPRQGKTYVGTTDTNYDGDIKNPRITEKDRDYLLSAVNDMFPEVNLKPEDVESSWAGLRPLVHEEGKDPSKISRKDEVLQSDSGLITIAGGKLTGYRKMAERVVDVAATELGRYPRSATRNVRLSGGDVDGSNGFQLFIKEKIREGTTLGLSKAEAEQLVHRYGSNVNRLFDIIQKTGEEARHYGLSKSVFTMIVYGVEEEMAATPSDFFIRRTGALFFDIDWVEKWKQPVINYMSVRLHWNEEAKAEYEKRLKRQLYEAAVPLKNKQ
jgi:glycerol-3-phosphate dehydrogenase